MEASGIHLWLVLWKAYEAVRRHAERHIHSLGLGFSDFAVLEVLLHKGPTPVNTIGELEHLTVCDSRGAVLNAGLTSEQNPSHQPHHDTRGRHGENSCFPLHTH